MYQVVSKTFHGAGIVVPVDKNDVGYRELPETDGTSLPLFPIPYIPYSLCSIFPYCVCVCVAGLKRICKAIVEAEDDEERMKAFAPLQEMMTFVQFANDECDYGMGFELGIDLFCYGSHVRNTHTHTTYCNIHTQHILIIHTHNAHTQQILKIHTTQHTHTNNTHL